ncbi:F-box only protein 46 [Aplochiton taeniatus]
MEDGRVLLDTWYVIKPGNTKEKIAFFVAHQFSGEGIPRPSAMKVKGNWATDCSKAKRRRRCSSYEPPTRAQTTADLRPDDSSLDLSVAPPSPEEPSLEGASDTDLLSVAEMVALVEQRTAMALQEMVVIQGHPLQPGPNSTVTPLQHTLLRGTLSDPTPMVFLSESGSHPHPPTPPLTPRSSSPTDLELDDEEEEEEEEGSEQQASRRVAEAIAHFESQNLESTLTPGWETEKERERGGGGGGGESSCTPPPTHGRGEVRIAFRVSSLDPRAQSEPAGRPRCMFMSCGGGGAQSGARAKEKITCDLYQLVSPSSRDPSSLLLATTSSPKADDHHHHHHPDRPTCGSPDPGQELPPGEKAAGGLGRERMTGFHVEVVVTGAVDQCVFYGKDSTENVQEETVCFALPGGAGGLGGSSDPSLSSDDPPPGQLFFLQSPRVSDDDRGGPSPGNGGGLCPLDCANNNNNGGGGGAVSGAGGDRGGGGAGRPDSPLACVVGGEDGGGDRSLCRLYRHVSHDFLEIRFQIQRLLEPRQYVLLLPDHIAVHIFSYLPTRALAALKCTCHDFRALIEAYGVRPTDSLWTQDPLYRDDPCKQCKRQYERGDVSLCRWHPKPYHHDLPYGRSYWMCCRRTDKDTAGCRVGLHDNNWVQPPSEGSQAPPRVKREDAG